jgi:hypothetical protein
MTLQYLFQSCIPVESEFVPVLAASFISPDLRGNSKGRRSRRRRMITPIYSHNFPLAALWPQVLLRLKECIKHWTKPACAGCLAHPKVIPELQRQLGGNVTKLFGLSGPEHRNGRA